MGLIGPGECFCGCGQKVKGLTRRGLNAAGVDALMVIGLLNHAEEVARERGRGDLEARTKTIASIREEGQQYVASMKAVTHGECPSGQRPLADFKVWRDHARGYASFLALDPELQAMISGGASDGELAEARAKLLD